MAKQSVIAGFWGEFFATSLYKRTQGRIVRQATFLAIVAIVCLGAWTLWSTSLSDRGTAWAAIPWAIAVIGTWLGFRLVNYPTFAEFLISVEAEVDKVSWAPKKELYRSTIVVITTMVLLCATLFLYDILWYQILGTIGILQIPEKELWIHSVREWLGW